MASFDIEQVSIAAAFFREKAASVKGAEKEFDEYLKRLPVKLQAIANAIYVGDTV